MFPMLRRNTWLTPSLDDTFGRLRNELNSVFDGVLSHEGGALTTAGSSVPLTVWEDEESFHIEADLPGVAESDVEVMVHNDVLHIKGERKPEAERKYLFNGRLFGRFERVLTLPAQVSSEAVQATLSSGVLRITLPKSLEARPKRITVQTN